VSQSSKTPLLDQVKMPADLRRLESGQLRQLADELRQETISAGRKCVHTAQTGS